MGLNSVLMIYNDAVPQIADDPKGFWREAWRALCQHSEMPCSFRFGYAVTMHHSNMTSLIAAGGNHASVIFRGEGFSSHHIEDTQVRLLKAAAKELGYRLVKRAKRKVQRP